MKKIWILAIGLAFAACNNQANDGDATESTGGMDNVEMQTEEAATPQMETESSDVYSTDTLNNAEGTEEHSDETME